MKALMRPGGGESNPSDGDQVISFLFIIGYVKCRFFIFYLFVIENI